MRHVSAAILAVMAIALTVFCSVGGFQPMPSTQPTLTGNVVVQLPISVVEPVPEEVTIVLADGFVAPGTVLELDNDAITFETGSVETLTVALAGFRGDAAFRIQRAPNPDAFVPAGGTVISFERNPDGSSYGALSYGTLRSLRDTVGSGWYVIAADYGTETLSVPLFIR